MRRFLTDWFHVQRPIAVPKLFFALALLTIPVFAGIPVQAQEMRVIRIGAGPTGATDFPFGGLIANAISNPPGSRDCNKGGNCGVPGLIAVAQTTVDAVDNLKAISQGDMEIGLSQADVTAWAYRGTAAFQDQPPMDNLRILARLYPENVHLVVREGSPIKSVTDLRGKTVAMGARNSGTEATARLILSAYDVKWNTVRMRFLGFAAVTEALANGSIDAFFMVSGAPVLALEDLASRTPISLVPITGPTADKLAQVFPYYSRGVIPAGTYGNKAPVETVDVGSVLVAREGMDPALAYGIVRAIWHDRNISLFQAGHPRGRLMDKTLAARDIGVPILEGADRYYIEQGLMEPPSKTPEPAPIRGSLNIPAGLQRLALPGPESRS